MKFVIICYVFLGININLIYAQNLSNNTKADSSSVQTLNEPSEKNSPNTGFIIYSNDFNKGAIFSPLQLIQGKVPGFAINCLNVNDPNPDIQTQLRGSSSVYLTNKPLYIVNGIALDNADFISVENIESIEVLKNISETALYGIRGVDGVILINTKESLPQKVNISYNTYGYVEISGKSDYMSASEWRKLKSVWANSNYTDLRNYAKTPDYNGNTDWLKEISQNKISQSHFLDISGTINKTSYMANVTYNNYKGIVQKTGNKMLSGQFYISQLALKNKLQVSLLVIGADREYSAINKSRFFNYLNGNILHIADQYNPTVPGNMIDTTDSYNRSYNPLQQLKNVTDSRTLNNSLADIALNYKLTENLKISTSYSAHKMVEKNSFSYSRNNYFEVADENNRLKEKIFTVNLNYNKAINNHHINVLLNYSDQLNAIEISNKDSIFYRASSGYYNSNEYKIINTSASVKYDYNNRYFLSVGVSNEKSPLYRYKYSTERPFLVKAGWSLTNEKFPENLKWLYGFKLYAGYGESKRQGSFDGIGNAIPNPDLHGEKLHESNFGVDVSLLSDILSFSVNYYNLTTNDGLELLSLRPSSGPSSVLLNDVNIKNNGWELNLKCLPLNNPVNWTINFNISLNNNNISSRYNTESQSFGSFYGYKFAGFSTTDNVLVFDKNGNPISYNIASYSADRKFIGNGIPKSFFGLYNNFRYKKFDLSISIRGASGFNIENEEYYSSPYLVDRNFKNYIQTVDQRALLLQNTFSLGNTDYIIEKGDYVKIDNITLGYTVPSLNKVIKSLKLYIGCNNVALLTRFTGGDPEMAGISGGYQGIYYKENYPFTRIFVLGLKCNL